jgi:hypothetical protein
VIKKKIIFISLCICLLISTGACTIRSDDKLSDEELSEMIAEYEKYLEEAYPDETFTVEIWQEYGKAGGGALPDYEGYLIRQVVTDSKGNRFKVYTSDEGSLFDIHRRYSDDYEAVLDGRKHYNEKGQLVTLDENGEVEHVLSD